LAEGEETLVKASEAEQQFAESKRLYAEGQYDKALAILARLDSEHPNEKHLLYPLALCYARLGRVNEAKLICDRLVTEFRDPKGAQLLALLGAKPSPAAPVAPPPAVAPATPMASAAPMAGLGIPGLQPIDLGDLNAPVVKYTPPPPEPAWKKWAVYGGVALGVLAGVVLVTFIATSVSSQVAGSDGQPVDLQARMMERLQAMEKGQVNYNAAYVLVSILGLLAYAGVLYGIVAHYDQLPYGETWQNLGHVALVTLGITVLQFVLLKLLGCCSIPISLIATILIIKKTYGLETMQVVVWYICCVVLGAVVGALQLLALIFM
jgi:tetratricopeptide (TPR) repeat protein